VLASKLYRPGSVAYVSRSGGLSNELNNIVSRNTNGVYEGIAIGGDRYPGTTFMDHLLRFQAPLHFLFLSISSFRFSSFPSFPFCARPIPE
jgi:hypothetical protein